MGREAVRKRIAWLIATGLVASALAMPGIAAAHTNEAIAETGGMMLTLPGVGLNVDIRLDEFGNIEDVVVVGPAAAPGAGGEVPTIDESHKARFEIDEDGTRLSVTAKRHKLASKVQAGTLAELVGPHEWSAKLFPELSTDLTAVGFTVGDSGGTPQITGVTVAGLPAGAGYTTAEGDDENAGAVVTFTWHGYTKVLKIKVDVDDDENDSSAVLKVELRAKDRRGLRDELGSFVGPHTWTGLLCDGRRVGVAFAIDDPGVLTVGDVTIGAELNPEDGYSVKDQERGFQVRFDGTKSRLAVKFGETDDGLWDLRVDARTTGKCKQHGDAAGKHKPGKDRPNGDHGEDDSEDDD